MEFSTPRRPRIRARWLPGHWLEALLAFHARQAGLVSVHGHNVLIGGLHAGAIVIDVGAHTGEFTRPLLRLGCTCYAVEPVAWLLAQLEDQPGLRKFCRAIAATNGEVSLHLSRNPEANSVFDSIARRFGSAGTITTRSTTLAAFLDEVGIREVDVLKLDIEGSEVAVLESIPADLLARTGQISVEFHDLLEGFGEADTIRRVRRRLSRAGFRCLVLSRASGHHGDTLFVNRRRTILPLGARVNLFLMDRVTAPLRAGLHRLSTALR